MRHLLCFACGLKKNDMKAINEIKEIKEPLNLLKIINFVI